jgi:hypothetical protein
VQANDVESSNRNANPPASWAILNIVAGVAAAMGIDSYYAAWVLYDPGTRPHERKSNSYTPCMPVILDVFPQTAHTRTAS